MSGQENILENPVFNALKHRFPDVYDMAQKSQALVMVPQMSSIPSGSISLRLIEAHVYRASPYFRDQYVSLDGRTVEVVGGQVVTQSGFGDNRKAKVLFEETFYNSDYKAFRVLCISQPLIGEVASIKMHNMVEPPADFSYAVACEWLDGLGLEPKGSLPALEHLNAAVREFNQTFVILKGFDEYVIRKVRGMVTSAATELRTLIPDLRGFSTQVLNRTLESYTLGQMHNHIFSGLRRIHEAEDKRISGIIRGLKRISMDDLGISKDFQADVSPAVAELNKLNQYQTPIDRLVCLSRTTNLITELVTNVDANPLATDDLLPLVVYVLIKSSVEWVESNLHYMSTFLLPEFASEELGFHMVTFQAATEYLKSKDVPRVGSALQTPMPQARVQPSGSGSFRTPVSAHAQVHDGYGYQGRGQGQGQGRSHTSSGYGGAYTGEQREFWHRLRQESEDHIAPSLHTVVPSPANPPRTSGAPTLNSMKNRNASMGVGVGVGVAPPDVIDVSTGPGTLGPTSMRGTGSSGSGSRPGSSGAAQPMGGFLSSLLSSDDGEMSSTRARRGYL